MLPNLRLDRDTHHPTVIFDGQGFTDNYEQFDANVGSGGLEVTYWV